MIVSIVHIIRLHSVCILLITNVNGNAMCTGELMHLTINNNTAVEYTLVKHQFVVNPLQ